MISVVVVTYNQERYIGQTLDHILSQQTDEQLEVLIGNDCSTDGTARICRQYQAEHNNIKLVDRPKNLGLVDNFIDLLKRCQGQYVALCDGDDYWTDTHKLQKQVDILKRHENIVLVHTNKSLLFEDTTTECPPLDTTFATTASNLLTAPFVSVPTVMLRYSAVAHWLDEFQTLVHERKWLMQDQPLWLYLGLQGDFYYLSEPTAAYRILQNSLSREVNKNRAYTFDCSALDIRNYFLDMYITQTGDTALKTQFKIFEFHERKRMIKRYGMIAIAQVWNMLKLLPYWHKILLRKIQK